MFQASIKNAVDSYESAVDEAIAMCGGDLRGALKALIAANEFLESELSSLYAAEASGFSRSGSANRVH
jgi:hypothetical protein